MLVSCVVNVNVCDTFVKFDLFKIIIKIKIVIYYSSDVDIYPHVTFNPLKM